MLKHIYSASVTLVALAILNSGCTTPQKSAISTESYESEIESKLNLILASCSDKPGAEKSIYNSDTISFNVEPSGSVQGIAYRSLNEISKDWVFCIEKRVNQTIFPKPASGERFAYSKAIDWDSLLIQKPTLSSERTALRKVIQQNKDKFTLCYDTYLAGGGKEKGKLITSFAYDDKGKVEDVKFESSEITDTSLLKCVKQVLMGMKPQAPSKKVVVFKYPFVFGKWEPSK